MDFVIFYLSQKCILLIPLIEHKITIQNILKDRLGKGGMNIYNMYKLLCIIYSAFCYVSLKVLTLYHGDIVKTGDKSSLPLRCHFQTKKTYTTVVKTSE